MPIFGQVWLWSLLAFLLGALLCWVLLVLPVRRRIAALESRLASVRADASRGAVEQRPQPVDRPPSSARGMVPGFDDTGNQEEIRSEMLTRAYALPGVADIPSTPYEPADEAAERGALSLSSRGGVVEHTREPATPQPPDIRPLDPTQYIGAHSQPLVAPAEDGPTAGSAGRDWFDEDPAAAAASAVTPAAPVEPPAPPASHRLIDDDEEVEERGTIFTQRTMPIPAEVIRQLDESGPPEAGARPEDALVDDLEDEPAPVEHQPEVDVPVGTISDTPPRGVQVDQETMRIERPQPVEPARPPAVTLDSILAGDAEPVRSEVDEPPPPLPEPEPEPEPEPVPLVSKVKATNRHTIEATVVHGNTLESEYTQALLPKRIPAKPQHRAPFGVQTVSPAEAHAAAGGERIRSLFEPMVPAESLEEAVPPPPHRLHTNESRPSAPGPFGPGSAMPLPGGASPSPEFTIKASVTALRYCTPESPQFGRTVAEVWFRSAADAERVGFRPVGSA